MFVVRTPGGMYWYEYIDEDNRLQYGLHSDKAKATQYEWKDANSFALSRSRFQAFVEAV